MRHYFYDIDKDKLYYSKGICVGKGYYLVTACKSDDHIISDKVIDEIIVHKCVEKKDIKIPLRKRIEIYELLKNIEHKSCLIYMLDLSKYVNKIVSRET